MESGDRIGFLPSPRECLIAALAAPPSGERARAIVDALDTYLEDVNGRAPVPFLAVSEHAQMEILRRELSAALERAEKAERALCASPRRKKDTK
jgi:hypothetical protein